MSEKLLISKKVQPLYQEFLALSNDASTLTFLPRGIELQRDTQKALEVFDSKAQEFLDDAAGRGVEDDANQTLALQLLSRALESELSMWISLKEERWDEAWVSLVDAQESAQMAVQANPIALKLNAANYLEKLEAIESVVFPPQAFNSMAYTAVFVCSVCGQEYERCEHVEGRAYLGKLCLPMATELKSIEEVSVVKKPKNKRSRITEFGDGDVMRNKMTWRTRLLTDSKKETLFGTD